MKIRMKSPTAITFRGFRKSDIPEVRELLDQNIAEYAGVAKQTLGYTRTWPQRILRSLERNDAHCIIAWDREKKKIAGLLIYTHQLHRQTGEDHAYIDLVLVALGYRATKLSKDLFILFTKIVAPFVESFSLDVTHSVKTAPYVYAHYAESNPPLLDPHHTYLDETLGIRTTYRGAAAQWAGLKPRRSFNGSVIYHMRKKFQRNL